MKLKSIKSSHFANYREAWEANRLLQKGMLYPILSKTYQLKDVGEAAYAVHRNLHEGKIGVLCLADTEDQGIEDFEMRDKVGESKLRLFRNHAKYLEKK